MVTKKRQNTKCESEGAEFLVLGNLMIHGIWTYKTYTNMPGYDLIAINIDTKKQCRIQVKSRWATDANDIFPLKNLDCDFVVFVRLNRGNAYKTNIVEPTDPQYWIVPIEKAKTGLYSDKFCRINKIEDISSFENNWKLIDKFLK